jgi:hypothetical protein
MPCLRMVNTLHDRIPRANEGHLVRDLSSVSSCRSGRADLIRIGHIQVIRIPLPGRHSDRKGPKELLTCISFETTELSLTSEQCDLWRMLPGKDYSSPACMEAE